MKMIYMESDSREAAFHFAVEEFSMQSRLAEKPILMIWRTERTVMLGRNQLAENEADLLLADRLRIRIVRRSSGGGAIFTDPGTLLISSIVPLGPRDTPAMTGRRMLAEPIVSALKELGIPAVLEGRNDILVEGKKVSGLAQWVHNRMLCTHASLLFDTDLSMMERVLNVDDAKIRSKAVASVRGRVVNLKPYVVSYHGIETFKVSLRRSFCRDHDVEPYLFSKSELEQIDTIRREKYANPIWNIEKKSFFNFHGQNRFPAGKIEVFLMIQDGIIKSCRMHGDFLSVASLKPIETALENQPHHPEAIHNILEKIDLSPYFGEITSNQLLSSFFPRDHPDDRSNSNESTH